MLHIIIINADQLCTQTKIQSFGLALIRRSHETDCSVMPIH